MCVCVPSYMRVRTSQMPSLLPLVGRSRSLAIMTDVLEFKAEEQECKQEVEGDCLRTRLMRA